MTVCLFVVNPIGVEQFIIASGRTTPLAFFFSLSCLYLLLESTGRRMGLGLLAYSLALLTKEISVITPGLLLLVFYFKNILWKRAWVLAPMLGLTAGYFSPRAPTPHAAVGALYRHVH